MTSMGSGWTFCRNPASPNRDLASAYSVSVCFANSSRTVKTTAEVPESSRGFRIAVLAALLAAGASLLQQGVGGPATRAVVLYRRMFALDRVATSKVLECADATEAI